MSFQILNASNEPISIGELDREAASFWGKEVHSKNYAYPQQDRPEYANIKEEMDDLMSHTNWFDVIGHAIHAPADAHSSSPWANVKHTIFEAWAGNSLSRDLFNEEKFNATVEAIRILCKPMYALIDHWNAKGYKPKQVIE